MAVSYELVNGLVPKEVHLANAGFDGLPSHWSVVEVGELLSEDRGISVGVMYPGNHDPFGVPLIKVGDLMGSTINPNPESRITPEKHHEYRRTEFEGGELLLTLVGAVGQCAIVPKSMAGWNAARAVAVMKLKDPEDAQFVRLCLLSRPLQHLMQVWSNTTVQTTLNLKEIKQLPLPWPPKEERERIAHILGTLDNKIELNQQMNRTLEGIARALLKSWFIDFDPVRAKLDGRQPYGMDAETAALFPNSFEDSPLGKIPKGWKIKAIQDIAQVTDYVANGSFASLKSNVTLYDEPEYALYIRTTDFKKGFSSTLKYTNQISYNYLKKTKLFGKEVIISNVGDTGTVFRPPVWLDMPMTLGSNAIAILENEFSNLLFYYFSSPTGQADIASIVSGSAQPKFNKTDFRSLKVLIPPKQILHKFNTLISSMEEKQIQSRREKNTLITTRDFLMPKLLSGEIRVKEAEQALEAVV